MSTNKGFIKDWLGNHILPITRAELVLDQEGDVALTSKFFAAGDYGNAYGLVTAAERAMLSGGGTGGGISDLYTKVEYINQGFKVGGTAVNFYNENGATPINLVSTGDSKISISIGEGNLINFGLSSISTNETSVSQLLRSIVVDKYGRVTSVTGSELVDADIPAELTSKTLINGVLNGCTTVGKEIGNDEKAIANKFYVDSKLSEIAGVATGALSFGGSIGDQTLAENMLTNKDYWNTYYKVVAEFSLNVSDLFDDTGITGSTVKLKIGDTLIVHQPSSTATKAKFVYIPSGDDITAITVKGDGETTDALTSRVGSVTLRFSTLFSVTNPSSGSGTAYISIPPATATQHGYLSKEDYAEFKAYSSSLSVSYDSNFDAGPGVYEIGTLTIGTSEKVIYGKNNISSLTVNNGSTSGNFQEYNPILKFTETGASDVNIGLIGSAGITIKKNNTNVEFSASNEVIEQDVPQELNPRKVKYLTLEDGYKFGVQIGKANNYGIVTQDGLTDFSQFNALVNKVSTTTTYEAITYSLLGEASLEEYRYGNEKMKAAIALTI